MRSNCARLPRRSALTSPQPCTVVLHNVPSAGMRSLCCKDSTPAGCLSRKNIYELVGARPLHLAALRSQTRNLSGRGPSILLRKTVLSLESPTGAFLAALRSQTRTCRGEAPPSCCARPFCCLKAPLGLSLLRCARKRGTCRGGAPPSC